MDFGERLRQLRLNKALSQRKLAKKVGIDFTYLSKIERGRMSPPSQETILKLAGALDADPDELLVLADRVPDDVKDVVTKSAKLPAFLRELRDLNDDDIEALRKRAGELRTKKNDNDTDSNPE